MHIDGDVGFNVGFPWSGMVHYLSFHGEDCEPKVFAGVRELVNAALHVRLGFNVEGAIISKQDDVDGIS